MKRHRQVGESRQHQVASAVGSSVTIPKSRIDADPQPTGHVRISAPYARLAGGAVALQPDPLHAQRLHCLVVGGGAEAAVSDHRARWPAGDADDPLDGGHELGSVGRVALVELVVGDEPALVLSQQQGVAELGWMPGLALADRAGVGVG
jgi:hypothetical protein